MEKEHDPETLEARRENERDADEDPAPERRRPIGDHRYVMPRVAPLREKARARAADGG